MTSMHFSINNVKKVGKKTDPYNTLYVKINSEKKKYLNGKGKMFIS